MAFTIDVSSKITTSHLGRSAYVYVRQSTLTQVREHTESLERQYELAFRAQALGWKPSQVIVIDEDLGRSGAETSLRDGFKNLVADVGLGKVGIILGIEVSRLARNNADWYQLLDLCAVTNTLIADGDGIYHPGDFNDRLVLGLKGTMSEAELHLIRHRLTAGLRHKAAKGELRQGVPVGFVYDSDDRVVFDADEAVIEAIATVFRRFDEVGSARQAMIGLRGDGVLIPRRPTGAKRVQWAPATYPAIHDFLTNPAYGGAFVFGRTRTDKRVDATGRLVSRTRQLPQDEWQVLIPDHHRGFVSWERYEQIQQQLRANSRPRRGEGGGAVREGAALLQGLIRCGKCGRMMQTGYSGVSGNCPRYLCGRGQQFYGNQGCQSLGGRRLEQAVLDEVFAVLAPATLAATVQALNDTEGVYRQRLTAFEHAVERTRFEAARAQRQFDAVEPENRLVARTVERAWETALTAQHQAEADLAVQRARRPTRLEDQEIAWLQHAGADLRRVFEAASTTIRDRKQLLRAIITEIVVAVRVEDRQADVRIIWEGGATNSFALALRKAGGHFRTTDDDTVELVKRLAQHYDDSTIASILAKQHRNTGTGLPFTRGRVCSLRNTHGIAVFCPNNVTPRNDDGDVVTIYQAQKLLGVDKSTIYRWLSTGFITGDQLTPGGPWHLKITEEFRNKIVPEVPEGWLRLDEAAAALGIARQTVLHKVQRRELVAVYVSQGKRKGLRIQVEPANLGLFATTE